MHLVYGPMVEIVQIVVHTILPYEPSYAATYAWRFVKYRFVRCYLLPFFVTRSDLAACQRVAEHCLPEQVP